EPGDRVAQTRERLALDVGRVRRCPPPGRLDRPPAVRRDDEVDPLLVQPLPELPPGRRAAVAEVEVDRGGDAEELRRAHALRGAGAGDGGVGGGVGGGAVLPRARPGAPKMVPPPGGTPEPPPPGGAPPHPIDTRTPTPAEHPAIDGPCNPPSASRTTP